MKKVMFGIIIGVLLATAIPVAAEEITKRVTATVRNDFSLEVDGQKVVLQNAPLAYNGSSYLPVREISTILGREVDFEDGVIKIISVSDDRNIDEIPISEMNISQVNMAISLSKMMIWSHKTTINNESTSSEQKEQATKELSKEEQRLAELEARKAELESE